MTTTTVCSDNIELLRNSVEVNIPSINPAPNLSCDPAGNMKPISAVIFILYMIVREVKIRVCV